MSEPEVAVRPLPRDAEARRADDLQVARSVGWLLSDRVVRLVVGLVVNVWIVRYLGAADLGLLGFTQSLVLLFALFSQLGLESIVVRDLVRRPGEAGEVLGTAFGLRLAGAAVTLALSWVAVLLMRPGDSVAPVLAALFGGMVAAQSLDVIECWFQSRSTVAPFVLARAVAFGLATALKVACLVAHAPLTLVAAAIASEYVFGAIGLAIAYHATGSTWSAWRIRRERAIGLLADAWPLMLSGFAIVVYSRTDQVMLTAFRGEAENGVYAAAQRLSEILYFIPSAVLASANAALLRSHREGPGPYERELGRLFTLLAWAAIVLAVPIALLASWLTSTLFGAEFRASGPVLALHVWAAPAVFLGVAQSNWFIAHGQQRGLLLRTVFGALVNVALNLVFIPRWGAVGSAAATLIAQWSASILLNLCFASTRGLFRLQCRAFLPVFGR